MGWRQQGRVAAVCHGSDGVPRNIKNDGCAVKNRHIRCSSCASAWFGAVLQRSVCCPCECFVVRALLGACSCSACASLYVEPQNSPWLVDETIDSPSDPRDRLITVHKLTAQRLRRGCAMHPAVLFFCSPAPALVHAPSPAD